MLAVLAMILAAGAAAEPYYEGVARDAFAAWSFTSEEIAFSGATRTTSVQTLYDTPTPFNGISTPVAYSIHTVAFDCAAKTAAFLNGTNYDSSGARINSATPSASQPWTDSTAGFQTLAATVCAMPAP
ncbi:MAG: hypothetical protein U1A07_23855 [Phenylobacterium sp.]|nr:hypothetical protein [Phenylobacterium sp.]